MSEDAKPATLATQKPTQNWFASWFDTPYYHILYKERNYREAQIFMDNLTHYLNLPEKAKVLDLACGKGRHAIYLNQLGFDVIGADLSENSIAEASKNSNSSLHFQVHDMREKFDNQFDAILFDYKTISSLYSYIIRYFINSGISTIFVVVTILLPCLAGELLHFETLKASTSVGRL